VSPDPLARLAPEVSRAFSDLQAAVWAGSSPNRSALVSGRITQLLGGTTQDGTDPARAPGLPHQVSQQLSRWPDSPLFSGEERACLEFAEQFVIDVAGVDDRLRQQLGSVLGPDELLEFVVALFALDYGQRVAMVFGSLFPDDPVVGSGLAGPAPTAGSVDGAALLGAFDDLSRVVARMDSLDPVTTELVRLRGARQHDCRLCRSTRSVRALDAGADEDLLDATERYETSDLVESRKVALRLTDALITRPGDVDGVLVAQVHEWFTPLQVVELVMDVMRNSGQKIAVALAADDPHVTEGIERFEITASGDVEYLH
jgi:alkylhydroperoxidase family enzyme